MIRQEEEPRLPSLSLALSIVKPGGSPLGQPVNESARLARSQDPKPVAVRGGGRLTPSGSRRIAAAAAAAARCLLLGAEMEKLDAAARDRDPAPSWTRTHARRLACWCPPAQTPNRPKMATDVLSWAHAEGRNRAGPTAQGTVPRDFFIFIFKKIKISKIYGSFEKFQNYTPVAPGWATGPKRKKKLHLGPVA